MTIFVSSRVLDAYGISDTARCQCGGFKCVVHCPQCGSTQCYANKRASVQQVLPDSPRPFTIRAFRCKLCSFIFNEVMCCTLCNARTRYRQKVEQEQRVEKTLSHVPSKLQDAILEAARKHQQRREVGPLEAAQIEKANKAE
jgi:hypothetical protein